MTIPKDCPPFFMVVTHDDKDRGVSVAKLYIMLKEAGVSAEMHVYESGGHGYGLRPTSQPVTTWPAPDGRLDALQRIAQKLRRVAVANDS